ncbi:MAG: sulfatase-like hydrolase/transferase [Planctomycetota bacterium]
MSGRRQIVLIMTDSQGVNVLGCYGAPGMYAPSIDRLAAEGVRFDRAYTTCPVCSPARSALFTGLPPHQNGVWGNGMRLLDGVPTMGQLLQDHGLKTGYIGKWHLDAFDYFGTGLAPDGWDEDTWYDMRNFLDELPPDERRRSRSWHHDPDHPVLAENTFAARCSDRGIDFLTQHTDDDFLLVVSYDEPHGPHRCPSKYRERYADFVYPGTENIHDDLSDKPDHHRAWSSYLGLEGEVKPIQADSYFGCNTFVDEQIGRVLDAVDRHTPDALVIFTSDHGYMLHAHRLFGKGPAMYDEITRIPVIARWPGRLPTGVVEATPVSHLDVMPTVLAAAGIEPMGHLSGSPLDRLIASKTSERAVFSEFNRFDAAGTGMGGLLPIRSACDGRHKLVLNLASRDELYDLYADPAELTNRIGDPSCAEIRDRLHARLLQWMTDTYDPFDGWAWVAREWATPRPEGWWSGDGREPNLCPVPYDANAPTPLDYTTASEAHGLRR